jgi:porphobilinogen synthase
MNHCSTILDNPFNLTRRPRRNRQSAAIRSLVQETHLLPQHLVAPLFVVEGTKEKQAIASMSDVYRYSVDVLVQEVIALYQLGIRAVALFCCIPKEKKDLQGAEAIREGNILQVSIRAIKREIPEMCVVVDIALDPFTSHGHDGIVNDRGYVVNDETLVMLGKMALLAAEAGADVVAPSDMMDGRVGYLRSCLDQNGFSSVSILSYAAKYASSFYGPFREIVDSTLSFGDKKGYQMNPGNVREALLECRMDEEEGADMLLIKPALPYLDVLTKVRERTDLPLGAYHVSGEYAMVMAAAQNGWLDATAVFMESFLSIRRAGADFIFTYAAKRMGEILKL